MGINLSPYGTVPVEAAPPAPAAAEGQTLTLQLRSRHSSALEVRASGTVAISELEPATANSLRAAVVAVDASALTITFR